MSDTQSEPGSGRPEERPATPLINDVHVVGRITNAVTFKDYGDGKKRAQLSVAVPRGGRRKEGQPDADFVAIVAWDDLAEEAKELSKGDSVDVEGRLRTWKDEAERYHWGITAESLRVLYRKQSKKAGRAQQGKLAGV